ncbi:MAG TPA: YicC/YloC family endoribonuclease [Vicinamibacteria bacterium]|jgi:uncharacterized protein (TIGR00255 family)|nr:YicC/YloC family endoribonuclease [Vicinamibacteria bacterium]
MIRSMTGYGSAGSEGGGLPTTVTVRSLNHRFLDLTLNVPRRLRVLEPELKGLVQSRVRRGRVELALRVSAAEDALAEVQVSQNLAASVVKALRELKHEYALSGDVTLSDVTRVPGVLEPWEGAEEEVLDERRTEILAVAGRALEGLDAMRLAEGQSLAQDLRACLREVLAVGERIASLAEAAKVSRREALAERARELVAELGLDAPRMYQEIVRFVERHDVSEELERLKSHVAQAQGLLDLDDGVGKRLDFLSQELMREANTVGSKAASTALIAEVVGLKGAIERFREQVQNVE